MTALRGSLGVPALLGVAGAEQIEATKLVYLGAAFALTWMVIAAYLFWIFRRQRRLEDRFEKIQAQANREEPKLAPDDKTERGGA